MGKYKYIDLPLMIFMTGGARKVDRPSTVAEPTEVSLYLL